MFDPLIILFALGFGLVARLVGLPPLVGYLAAGFALHETTLRAGPVLNSLGEMGVTLLLFTIGLKLNARDLLKTRVWGTTVIHMACMQGFFLIMLLLAGQLLPELGLDLMASLVIAFALTFSSTVFVIQMMQAKGEMSSDHANQAIGILIIQDIAAVIFLASTQGKLPQPEALLLLALLPLRPIILRIMSYAGHGELFTLCGFALALLGAQLFEQVGIKADLGALIIGAVLAGDQKSKELARNMLQFKDLFLVCFFLLIGLQGWPSSDGVLIAVLLGVLALVKPVLYFPLMTRLHTPPRTALLASSILGNFSEFGLVVITVAASVGWVEYQWSSIFSLVIATSFLLASPLSKNNHDWYSRFHSFWMRFESTQVRGAVPDTSEVRVMVLGMGKLGTGAYDTLAEEYGKEVLGVDLNERKLAEHTRLHRRVVIADASDPDFWHRVALDEVKLILLVLTQHQENLLVGRLLRDLGYTGQVSVVVRFEEEAIELETLGFSAFNLYDQAGAGFAGHALEQIQPKAGNVINDA